MVSYWLEASVRRRATVFSPFLFLLRPMSRRRNSVDSPEITVRFDNGVFPVISLFLYMWLKDLQGPRA